MYRTAAVQLLIAAGGGLEANLVKNLLHGDFSTQQIEVNSRHGTDPPFPALLLVGGLKAIQTAMVIGALPFSLVMVLQCAAIVKAIYNDGRRQKAGIATTLPVEQPGE